MSKLVSSVITGSSSSCVRATDARAGLGFAVVVGRTPRLHSTHIQCGTAGPRRRKAAQGGGQMGGQVHASGTILGGEYRNEQVGLRNASTYIYQSPGTRR